MSQSSEIVVSCSKLLRIVKTFEVSDEDNLEHESEVAFQTIDCSSRPAGALTMAMGLNSNQIVVRDVNTVFSSISQRKRVFEFQTEEHTKVSCVAVSPDGRSLAFCTGESRAYLVKVGRLPSEALGPSSQGRRLRKRGAAEGGAGSQQQPAALQLVPTLADMAKLNPKGQMKSAAEAVEVISVENYWKGWSGRRGSGMQYLIWWENLLGNLYLIGAAGDGWLSVIDIAEGSSQIPAVKSVTSQRGGDRSKARQEVCRLQLPCKQRASCLKIIKGKGCSFLLVEAPSKCYLLCLERLISTNDQSVWKEKQIPLGGDQSYHAVFTDRDHPAFIIRNVEQFSDEDLVAPVYANPPTPNSHGLMSDVSNGLVPVHLQEASLRPLLSIVQRENAQAVIYHIEISTERFDHRAKLSELYTANLPQSWQAGPLELTSALWVGSFVVATWMHAESDAMESGILVLEVAQPEDPSGKPDFPSELQLKVVQSLPLPYAEQSLGCLPSHKYFGPLPTVGTSESDRIDLATSYVKPGEESKLSAPSQSNREDDQDEKIEIPIVTWSDQSVYTLTLSKERKAVVQEEPQLFALAEEHEMVDLEPWHGEEKAFSVEANTQLQGRMRAVLHAEEGELDEKIQELQEFLESTDEYSPTKALRTLIDHGFLAEAVLVATSRSVVPQMLQMLPQHSFIAFTRDMMKKIGLSGCARDLVTLNDGAYFNSLSPDLRVQLLILDEAVFVELWDVFIRLLPVTSPDLLVQVIARFEAVCSSQTSETGEEDLSASREFQKEYVGGLIYAMAVLLSTMEEKPVVAGQVKRTWSLVATAFHDIKAEDQKVEIRDENTKECIQNRIIHLIHNYKGCYDGCSVLFHCVNAGNWEAAATTAEVGGAWAPALDLRLLGVCCKKSGLTEKEAAAVLGGLASDKSGHATKSLGKEEVNSLLSLIDSHILRGGSVDTDESTRENLNQVTLEEISIKSSMLAKLLCVYNFVTPDASVLEMFFEKKFDGENEYFKRLLVSLLSILFLETDGTHHRRVQEKLSPSQVDQIRGIQLSSNFFLRLTQLRIGGEGLSTTSTYSDSSSLMQPTKEEFLRSLQHHFGLWQQSLLSTVFEPSELLNIDEQQQQSVADGPAGKGSGKHRRDGSGGSWPARHSRTFSLDSRSSTRSHTDQQTEDLIVFSCGHQAFRRELLDVMVPDVFSKLQEYTNCFAWTTEMLIHEYEKTNIECACPNCVANTLKDMVEQLTKVENMRVP